MATMPEEESYLYGATLRLIQQRVEIAENELMARPLLYVERVALNLRICIEQIVLASLIPSKEQVAEVASAFHRKDYKDAAKILDRVNPDYWPDPFKGPLVPDSHGNIRPNLYGQYLRFEDWRAEWGFLSELLYAQNPFDPGFPRQPSGGDEALHARLLDLASRVAGLVRGYMVFMTDETHFHVFNMMGDQARFYLVPRDDLSGETQ